VANPYSRCGECKGNMWPSGQKDHMHLPEEEKRKVLKLKYRVRKTGWNKPAPPRTNPAGGNKNKKRSGNGPRKRAYGPF